MRQYRNFVFTVNNPQGDLDPAAWPNTVFCVWQLERGGENGTPHFQGYAELSKRSTLAKLKAFDGLERAHIEARRGTQAQAIAYCEKEDTRSAGPWRHGEPRQQGKRTDLLAVKAAIDDGEPDEVLWQENFATMTRYHRSFGVYRHMTSEKRAWPTRCIILVGPTGCGKTRWAHEAFPGLYVKGPGKWWDGYSGEPVVLIDEMYGNRFPYGELLQLTDRYPHRVEVKGGMVNFAPRTIIFTSNVHPRDWYNDMTFAWPDSALRRRLTSEPSMIYVAGEPQRFVGEISLHLPGETIVERPEPMELAPELTDRRLGVAPSVLLCNEDPCILDDF